MSNRKTLKETQVGKAEAIGQGWDLKNARVGKLTRLGSTRLNSVAYLNSGNILPHSTLLSPFNLSPPASSPSLDSYTSTK
jgi:hypothetical protein